MIRYVSVTAAAFALFTTGPAMAGEIYGGFYAHEVDTPFTFETDEDGADIQLGYRFDEIASLPVIGGPQPYVFGSVNTAGDTSFIGGGLSWKIGVGPLYVRPGVGLVVHDGPTSRVNPETGLRTDLGSRILFEPEIAVGVNIAPRVSVEASWVHISNARLFNSEQNPGIDMIGLRVNLAL